MMKPTSLQLNLIPTVVCLSFHYVISTSADVLLDFGWENGGSDIVETVPWEGDAVFATGVQDFTGDSIGLSTGAGLTSQSTTPDQFRTTRSTAQWLVGETAALDNDVYWTFTVAPATNYELTLESLSIDAISNGNKTDRATRSAVYTSADGFTLGKAVSNELELNQAAVNYTFTTPLTINVPTEIRLYLWADALVTTNLSGSGSHTWKTDPNPSGSNIANVFELNGTASIIPEPSAVLLLGAGTALFLFGRRRRGSD